MYNSLQPLISITYNFNQFFIPYTDILSVEKIHSVSSGIKIITQDQKAVNIF